MTIAWMRYLNLMTFLLKCWTAVVLLEMLTTIMRNIVKFAF